MPYNRNIYQLEVKKLGMWLVPVQWRKIRLMVLVTAMTATWADLYNRFALFRKRIKYSLEITPQVCYLEKALNDKYDTGSRRIYISDGEEHYPIILYKRDENKPVLIYQRSEDNPVYLRSRNEMAEFGVDFVVYVPSDVVFDMLEMRTFVSGYKLATKTFVIVTV